MKFSMEEMPQTARKFSDVEVGNVYRTQKKIYVIAHIIEKDSACGDNAVAFAVSQDGYIENVVCYTVYYFSNQRLIGKAVNMPETVDICWL